MDANVQRCMTRTRTLIAVGLTAFTLLAATGCTSERRITSSPTDPTGPQPTSTDLWDGQGSADQLLLRLGTDFPSIVIGADGTVYRTDSRFISSKLSAKVAPPSPFSAAMTSAQITPEGLRAIHDRAEELGLLKDPGEYEPSGATDTVGVELVLIDNSGTYTHTTDMLREAAEETDAKRRAFAAFVDDLTDLDDLTDGEIGREKTYLPARYLVSLEKRYSDRTKNEWPSGVDVVEGCAELADDEFVNGPLGRFGTHGLNDSALRGKDIVVRAVLPGVDCADDGPTPTGPTNPGDPGSLPADLQVIIRLDSGTSPGPSFVMTADGTFYGYSDQVASGLAAAQPPAPMPPKGMYIGRVSADAVDQIWELADRLDLLRTLDENDYGMITDSSTTVLRLTHDGKTYTHTVFGLEHDRTDGLRGALSEFMSGLNDLSSITDDDVTTEPYRPTMYDVVQVPNDYRIKVDELAEWTATSNRLSVGCQTVNESTATDDLTGWYRQSSADGNVRIYAVSPAVPGTNCMMLE